MDEKYIRKVRRTDRIAGRLISAGGILVIASVVAILVLIVKVSLPLFFPAQVKETGSFPLPPAVSSPPLAVGLDDYREVGYVLDRAGTVTFFGLTDGQPFDSEPIATAATRTIKALDFYQNRFFNLLWDDNSLTMIEIRFVPRYDAGGARTIMPGVARLAHFEALPDLAAPLAVIARRSAEGETTRVDRLADNTLRVTRQVTVTDLFDNTRTESHTYAIDEELPGEITALTMDEGGTALYAGTGNGYLLRWDIAANDKALRTDTVAAADGQGGVTSLQMVFGDQAVALGDAGGGFATWTRQRSESAPTIRKLNKFHTLTPHQEAVARVLPSRRNKNLYSLSARGVVHADHMTSENHLFAIDAGLQLFGISSRNNSLIGLDRRQQVKIWAIDDPHPEISFKTLFGQVRYEGYDSPALVWQSSSQSDDSEPKFSITPLIFGTVKGTLYAMIFAIPLGVFGAVYTSQFTDPRFNRTIKPVIEILASIPSVVIGFLIALWLAPIIEKWIVAVLLALPLLPLVFVVFMALMQAVAASQSLRSFIRGYEFLVLVPVLIATGMLALYLAPLVEATLFNGDFRLWLYNDLGMRYDQRNCIIIAFGLGICVVPIIFSITEDALSNIPPSLAAASLALGASRWQTVWRVILPSASPGIFAAIIIGFGRAVGETMIVLMATGNTPIMDWSIFNGMRTLSANIAVEIPEAPVGGTLYRVLFLCATILFGLTFLLNTGADIIRERLRKKYGRY